MTPPERPPRLTPPPDRVDADRRSLAEGVQSLGLAVPAAARDGMLAFRDLLVRWNRVHNLTAVRDPRQMIARHLLDSLAVAPYLVGSRCLDVGSGAGLPGIPLALAEPERQFTLLDSRAKRTRFLRQAVIELELGNVEVVHSRVEVFHPPTLYDTVVSRAFARLTEFIRVAGPLCAPSGELLAMKGAWDNAEAPALPGPWRIEGAVRLRVPGLRGERHLIKVKRETT